MTVKVIEKKGWKVLATSEIAIHLNKGDVFLPDGTGFEYEVICKVMSIPLGKKEYEIDVLVKKR